MSQAFIYDAIRTPRTRAKPNGGLAKLTPQELLNQLYHSLQERNRLDPALIGEVVLGCVTQSVEQAANIACTSVLYSGWPESIGGMTVNRYCSSSIDAINIGALKINSGQEQAMVCGGVEMMSRVPMLSDQARVFTDPAFALQCKILLMGSGADLVASLEGITREQADAIALQSQQRALTAQQEGRFTSIVPIKDPGTDTLIDQDECIRDSTTEESLARMKPAFSELGESGIDDYLLSQYPTLERIEHIHTAGNSPAMADAASVVLLGDEALGEALNIRPRAFIRAAATATADPLQVLTGCQAATEKLLQQQQLKVPDIDLFEIHEAFAATVLKYCRDLALPQDKLNVNGGVIALGHPMGATGAIMLGCLLDEMERQDLQLGVVAASGAAGSGSALLIERY